MAADGAEVAAAIVVSAARAGRVHVRMNANGKFFSTSWRSGGGAHPLAHFPPEGPSRRHAVAVHVLERRERATRPQRVLDAVEDRARHRHRKARERQPETM